MHCKFSWLATNLHEDPSTVLNVPYLEDLFVSGPRSWTSLKYCEVIRRMVKCYFGQKYGVRAWRQLMCAVVERHVADLDSLDHCLTSDEASSDPLQVFNTQIGHSSRTARYHYATTSSSLSSLSYQSIAETAHATSQLHLLLRPQLAKDVDWMARYRVLTPLQQTEVRSIFSSLDKARADEFLSRLC